MQVSYNRLENPSKNLWCNRQFKTGQPETGKPCCSRQIGEISWKPKKLGYGNKHPKGPVWWSTYLEEYKL
jgi:hypothetical protein